MNTMGTAAVVANRQYKGLWALGKHKGKYEALVQVSEVAVHRDNDLNSKVSYSQDNIQTGLLASTAIGAVRQNLDL